MKGILFGEYHSYHDLNLILTAKEIGSPAVKERKIEIEGANGVLDLTDFFGGEPKYENVRHSFEFSTIAAQAEFLSLFSSIKNALHGKRMRIILDDDPLFYYFGRVFVSSFTHEKGIGKIDIECDCEPYKYKALPTIWQEAVNGTTTITLTNSRKRAVPEVKIASASSSIRIEFQGNIWTLGNGSYTLPELELTEGDNDVSVTGTGTITFTWQEGDL